MGQHVQPVRPDRAVRRLQGVRLRPGGRPSGLAAYLPIKTRDAICSQSRKTYKLYIGGAFPRSESGRTYPVRDAQGRLPGQRRAGLPQGRPGRGRRRPQGVRRLVRRHRVQPGPGDLPDRRDAGGPARAVRRELAASEGVDRPSARSPSWTPRSTAGSATRAGPTSSPPCSARRTRLPGPYFSFSAPEPTGVVAVLAPQDVPLLGLVSVIAPIIASGNAVVVVAGQRAPAAGGHAGRGAGHLRRARRRGQHPHRPHGRDRPQLAAARRRQRPGPDRRGRRRWPHELERAAAGTVKRVFRAGRRPDCPRPRHRRGCGRSWRSRRSGTRWECETSRLRLTSDPAEGEQMTHEQPQPPPPPRPGYDADEAAFAALHQGVPAAGRRPEHRRARRAHERCPATRSPGSATRSGCPTPSATPPSASSTASTASPTTPPRWPTRSTTRWTNYRTTEDDHDRAIRRAAGEAT